MFNTKYRMLMPYTVKISKFLIIIFEILRYQENSTIHYVQVVTIKLIQRNVYLKSDEEAMKYWTLPLTLYFSEIRNIKLFF